MLLLGEKNGGWWGKKNKSTAPSLTFPFAINLSKVGNKAEKENMLYGGSGIKKIC